MNKRLKRMVSAVLLILALGLAACDQVSELKEVSNSTAKEEQVSTEQVAAENENVNPIIGIWENDKDVVTFNEDGTYEASYYWWGGTYRVDETNSIITIVSKLSGKKEYYYTLENDTLILQNISNGKIGSVRLEFTRAEADSAFYPIIGTWENDKEVITFNSNGTFEASYYWWGGTYRVDETNYELTLVADVNGKDKYFFIIDGDTLKLFGLNSKGQTTDRELVFTRVE